MTGQVILLRPAIKARILDAFLGDFNSSHEQAGQICRRFRSGLDSAALAAELSLSEAAVHYVIARRDHFGDALDGASTQCEASP